MSASVRASRASSSDARESSSWSRSRSRLSVSVRRVSRRSRRLLDSTASSVFELGLALGQLALALLQALLQSLSVEHLGRLRLHAGDVRLAVVQAQPRGQRLGLAAVEVGQAGGRLVGLPLAPGGAALEPFRVEAQAILLGAQLGLALLERLLLAWMRECSLASSRSRAARACSRFEEPFSCSRKAVSRSASAQSQASCRAFISVSRLATARSRRTSSVSCSSAPGPVWRARGRGSPLAVGVAGSRSLPSACSLRSPVKASVAVSLVSSSESRSRSSRKVCSCSVSRASRNSTSAEATFAARRSSSAERVVVALDRARVVPNGKRRRQLDAQVALALERRGELRAQRVQLGCVLHGHGKGLLERRGLEPAARRPPAPPPREAGRSPRGRRAPGAS